jgi:sulfite exporter TauE/SafE
MRERARVTPVEFSVVFALGLASSLHCLGMCGPIVLSYGVALRGPRLAAHAAYNAGRVLTYLALGAVAGTAGRGIGLLGQLAGLASGARIFAGAAMIFAGVLMIGLIPSNSLVQIGKLRPPTQIISPLILGTGARHKFFLGLMLGWNRAAQWRARSPCWPSAWARRERFSPLGWLRHSSAPASAAGATAWPRFR